MLVLSRKPGQSLYIGDDVKITVVEVKGNQVRVGIEAPASIRVYREEIYLQILEENRSAAALSEDVAADLRDFAKAWKERKPSVLLNTIKNKKNTDEG